GNTAVAFASPRVNLPAGATSATFSVSTQPVAQTTPVEFTASYGGANAKATLTLLPPVAVASVALTPGTVEGGRTCTGTVTLSAPAPAGGAAVSLISGNTVVVTVPATITVTAGTNSASFAVTTRAVTSPTDVSLFASYAGTQGSAALHVIPP